MNAFLTSLFTASSPGRGGELFALWGTQAILPEHDIAHVATALESTAPEAAIAFRATEDPKERAGALASLGEENWRRFRMTLGGGVTDGGVAARKIGLVMEQKHSETAKSVGTEAAQALVSLLEALNNPAVEAVPPFQQGSMRYLFRILRKVRFDEGAEAAIREVLLRDEALRLILESMDPSQPVSKRAAEFGETLLELHALKYSSPEKVASLLAQVAVLTPEAVHAWLLPASAVAQKDQGASEEAFTTA